MGALKWVITSWSALKLLTAHHAKTALTGIGRAQLIRTADGGFALLPDGCAVRLDSLARDQILRP